MAQCGIKMVHSTPYYPKANGQAEPTNKSLITLIKKQLEDNPRAWHEKPEEVLWAYRNARHTATKSTTFRLTYGQDVVLPLEIIMPSLRVLQVANMEMEYNHKALLEELDQVPGEREEALVKIRANQIKVARAYNKRVKKKQFEEGDLVWKVILPEHPKDPKWCKERHSAAWATY